MSSNNITTYLDLKIINANFLLYLSHNFCKHYLPNNDSNYQETSSIIKLYAKEESRT